MDQTTELGGHCFCKSVIYKITVPISSLPLQSGLCVCADCRHASGSILVQLSNQKLHWQIVCACFCPSKLPCHYQGSKQSQEMAVVSGDSTYLCYMLRYSTLHGRCLWWIPGGDDGCFFGKFGGPCFQGWSEYYQAKELCLVWLWERTGLDERIVATCRG